MDGMTITGATLTPQLCSRILETAIRAGYMRYWAELLSTDHSTGGIAEGIRCWSIRIREHGETEEDQGNCYTINHIRLEQAVSAMLKDPKGTHCEGFIPQLMSENGLDGPLADAIIQVACFGEIKYS